MNAPVRNTMAGLLAARARGRLPPGTMNKTEVAYAKHLEGLKASGEVLWFKFEGFKLRLAPSCTFSPDFVVMRGDGQIECHDVKGLWTDDAKVKMRVAADAFPFRFIAVRALSKKAGGGWEVEEF